RAGAGESQAVKQPTDNGRSMTSNSAAGWIRLFITLAILTLGYVLIFVLNSVEGFLRWMEFSSGSPGISGAFIVAALIGLFIGACFLVNWIVSGFKASQ
ncbi:MAG: hypothetical protein K0U93_28740, partial [Gammaproteobacteria bacterium]|nr:hypothetical protein [Gammaproteobacteria bacterium]